MLENLTNKTFQKKNQNELHIDELILNNCLLSNNQFDEKIIRSNILLNSLQDFFKRCEVNYGKLFYQKNYLVSLNEIITLIQNSIIAQQQLDKYIYNDNIDDSDSTVNNIKLLNQKFINDLNYNIFSIEKINNNYFSFNKIKKKSYKNKKSSSTKIHATPHNVKSRINSIFNNIYKDVFMNKYEILKDTNYSSKEINTYHNNSKSSERNKENSINKQSSSLNNKEKKDKIKDNNKKIRKNVISRVVNNKDKNKNKSNSNNGREGTIKNKLNISNLSNMAKNDNTFTNKEVKDNNQNRNNHLKLDDTSRASKSNKNIKCLDIFKVCQKIRKNKDKENNESGQIDRSNSSHYFVDINDFNDSFLKNSLKCLGFSQVNEKQKEVVGIKKIIVSNACKPTNFANHLLNKGKKYINDFKKMDEESKKWK
jgi:hypothetical protein